MKNLNDPESSSKPYESTQGPTEEIHALLREDESAHIGDLVVIYRRPHYERQERCADVELGADAVMSGDFWESCYFSGRPDIVGVGVVTYIESWGVLTIRANMEMDEE